MIINQLLRTAVERGASDLHLVVPSPPILRLHTELVPLEGEPLTPTAVEAVFFAITCAKERDAFYRNLDLDFAYSLAGLSRFRVNASLQRGSIALTFRCLPTEVPTIDKLGLPEVCKALALRQRGLVLVTGSPSSGKSTTQAAMVNYLNERENRKIITIEDPIEFLHPNKKCLVVQRELGGDTISFASAVRHALRQDADVILIGEIRDLDTIVAAITAAETGHLVLGTSHTIGAANALDRLINEFPAGLQEQARTQLALVLEGVLAQTLIPRADGRASVAAFEIMLGTFAIRNLIRDKKIHQILSVLEVSGSQGMQSLDQALSQLVFNGSITPDDALLRAQRPDDLRTLLLSRLPSLEPIRRLSPRGSTVAGRDRPIGT